MILKPKLKAEQRIELVHVSLMRNPAFALFAGLFMVGRTSVSDLVPTARTNGRDAEYGRGFVDSLSDKELAFLVMHENMHKCYRHLTTWKGLHEVDHHLANMACDHVINIQLYDMDKMESVLSHPRDPKTGKYQGWFDERFRGMDAKQVFDILRQEQEEGGGGGGQGEGDQDGGPSPDGGNGHRGKDRQAVGNSLDEHDWDGAKDGMSEEEKKQLEHDIDHALRQGAIYAGKVGGNMTREIGELLAPKVDWRAVLKRFVKTNLRGRDAPSWRKAHKNYLWQDVILPAIIGKKMKHLVIAMDTSGSIQGPLLDAFMSELNKLVLDVVPDRVDILYWDTRVDGHETYTNDLKSIVSKTSPRGGGGTDPDCVPKFMQEHSIKPDALVVLTDGYMHSNPPAWASLTAPTLWCVIGNADYTPPKGQIVNIKEI
jgi:predicted metal-dependent peptidase